MVTGMYLLLTDFDRLGTTPDWLALRSMIASTVSLTKERGLQLAFGLTCCYGQGKIAAFSKENRKF